MSFKKLFDITIYETDNFQANQDWEVPIAGFFILAPKHKVSSITEFTEEESHELINLVRKIRNAMRTVLKIKEVTFFQDEKFDFHIWMLPRYGWMNKIRTTSIIEIMRYAKKNMNSPKNLKEVEEAARKVKEYLHSKVR